MAISVTDFKNNCLDVIRRVEKTGRPVSITRRGRIVARVSAVHAPATGTATSPWEQLRALGGRLHATADESVIDPDELDALR